MESSEGGEQGRGGQREVKVRRWGHAGRSPRAERHTSHGEIYRSEGELGINETKGCTPVKTAPTERDPATSQRTHHPAHPSTLRWTQEGEGVVFETHVPFKAPKGAE
ncbi:hypothetical protein AAFF_G00108490 [Aldrovandia affinis]|uniref:Uncharacterized protein n=1 Tax=Aldrovandia affinis TaxID=143900 RepID=A0AAD7RU60_9TELE|nr:hypothetical protein AAFF_G00108490 [Aldrovandia affinis]